jgi:hypothetical protein
LSKDLTEKSDLPFYNRIKKTTPQHQLSLASTGSLEKSYLIFLRFWFCLLSLPAASSPEALKRKAGQAG